MIVRNMVFGVKIMHLDFMPNLTLTSYVTWEQDTEPLMP